jgi:drug/metabolite transporter (DMT)-like permease
VPGVGTKLKPSVWVALIAVYIVWGSTYLAIRFAVETIPPFLMASSRFLVAGAFLYGWRRLSGDPAPRKIEWRSAAVVGVLLLVIANGLVSWSEQYVASGVAALLVASAPLWMVLIDALRPGGRRPNGLTAAGVMVGFGGVVLLVEPWRLFSDQSSTSSLGVLLLLISALSWSIGSLYSRGARLPRSPLLGTGMEMLAGGIGLLLVGSLIGEWQQLQLSAISSRSLWGLAYLVVFGSLVGFVAYTWLLRNAPTPLVSTYAFVNPLVAIFIGSLFADELLTPRILASALIVVSSVVLINWGRRVISDK